MTSEWNVPKAARSPSSVTRWPRLSDDTASEAYSVCWCIQGPPSYRKACTAPPFWAAPSSPNAPASSHCPSTAIEEEKRSFSAGSGAMRMASSFQAKPSNRKT